MGKSAAGSTGAESGGPGGCRNHGCCLWCQDNRRHFDTRWRMAADYDLNNWKEEIA